MDQAQAHLPEEPNRFIGREREIAELRRVLRQARALTLCGPGGIGKTRLALRILAAAAAEFPDGTFLVELADLRRADLGQADLIVSRVAAALGVSEEAGRPLADTLADALRPRRLLLGLDNCEHLIEACAEVAGRLLASAPGLRVLITSREPLRIAAETVWQVPPLSVAPAGPAALRYEAEAPGYEAEAPRYETEALRYEAVRLFGERAAAADPGFVVDAGNAVAVAAVCRALDGIPLAIELAAARVRVLSPEQIRARMDDRFGLLTSGDRSAAPRHQTLRATIEWSYELLAPAERVLFRRLSVFSGWSLEMAEAVCADHEIPAADVLGLIAALMDKSLVAPEPAVLGQARYRMLDGAEPGHRDGPDPGLLGGPGGHVPPVRRRGREPGPGAGLVPGARRRGDRAADVHRGQPVLDRVGHVRRGPGVAGPVAGPSGGIGRSGRGARRGHGGARPARHVQRSRRGRAAGQHRTGAVP